MFVPRSPRDPRNPRLGALLLAACLILAPFASRAAVVAPGSTVPLSGTTFAANPDLGGTVLSDALLPFEIRDSVGSVLIRGTVQDRVVRSTNTGTLIFAPRLRDLTAPSGDAWVMHLRVTGYDGVATDVEYRTDGPGQIGPDGVTRSGGAGDQLDFRHDPSIILPPDAPHSLSILTDAGNFGPRGSITISAQNDFGGSVFQTTLQGTHAPEQDSDGDGVADSIDLCPATPDPAQVDTDGNGIGDLCECGDQTGDGTVNVQDVIAINAAIFDPALAQPLCDTNEDARCDVADVLGANAKIFGAPAYCAAYPSGPRPVPSFEVDPDVKPDVEEIAFVDGSDSRPVAAITDDRGNKIDFVENEIIVSLEDPAGLPELLDRLGATVIREIHPADAGAAGLPSFYLLRAAPPEAAPDELADLILASGAENGAAHRVSSQPALDLLTAIARESGATSAELGANFLVSYDGLSERTTTEAVTGTGGPGYTRDAFQWPYMSQGSTQDIGAAEAARLVRDAGRVPAPGNRVDFLIIDGGFSSTADYPTPVLPGASRLDVRNPGSCSGGTPCPWHGTAVASTAMSIFDDGVGAAGPASEVVRPIFVQSPNPNFWDYLEFAFDTVPSAIGSFPEIVNISASGDIPAGLCLVGVCAAVDAITATVRAAGMLVFASAGNDSANVDDEDCFIGCWESAYRVPCEGPGVICVGGMFHDTTVKDPSSAFGSKSRSSGGSVDIYAPFSTWTHDDPDGGTTNAVFKNGTSFSSPFAASIGALIKAANPSLGPGGIWDTMRNNAHTLSFGSVHRWVDAYEAVRAALGGNAPPFARVVSPLDGQRFSWNASSPPLTCDVDDDGGAGALAVSWTSDRDGSIGGASATTSAGFLSLGTHGITCTASDGTFTATDSVTIQVVNDPPTARIDSPAPGATLYTGQSIPVAATVMDINGNSGGIQWTVLQGGTSVWGSGGSTATIPAGRLAPGTYTLRVTAIDSLFLTGSDEMTIVILPDPVDLPPSIINPQLVATPSGDPFDSPPTYFWVDACTVDVNGPAAGNGWCQRLTFSATVSDDHDAPGALTYRFDVLQGGVVVDSVSPGSARATFDLVAGDYVVRLVVRDIAGNESSFGWAPFRVDILI